jgi:uncharacterized phage-associated protein
MTTVFDVADYFLTRNDPADGDRITALKLQKLVYYAQGYSLAILGKPLFDEPFHAWEHGPVCIPLYRKFKKFKDAPLDRIYVTVAEAAKAFKLARKPFTQEESNLLEDVFACYSGYTAGHLRRMTHETSPWERAFPNGEITIKAMKNFFSGQLKGVSIEPVPLSREEADKIAARLGVSFQ